MKPFPAWPWRLLGLLSLLVLARLAAPAPPAAKPIPLAPLLAGR